MIPPLAVVLISSILAVFAVHQPIPAQALVSTPPTQPIAPTALAMQLYDGSGQPVPSGSQAGQVYDGSAQPVDPNAAVPVQGQLYDGSGQPVQQSVPLYDGSGQLVVSATPAAQGIIQAEIVNQGAPVSADPIRTPIWNFLPDSQPAAAAAAAAPAVIPDGSSTSLAPFFRPEVLYWKDAILRWSAQAGLDPNLAAVVMQIESCGDPTALSRSGAIGLFQVMPFHFRSGDDPYDPDTNALRGLGYLARSLQSAGGDVRLALAGYNGGIGVIARGEWTWAAETARYVYFGWPIYEDAHGGLGQSAALEDWYNRYGANLCRQASQHQY